MKYLLTLLTVLMTFGISNAQYTITQNNCLLESEKSGLIRSSFVIQDMSWRDVRNNYIEIKDGITSETYRIGQITNYPTLDSLKSNLATIKATCNGGAGAVYAGSGLTRDNDSTLSFGGTLTQDAVLALDGNDFTSSGVGLIGLASTPSTSDWTTTFYSENNLLGFGIKSGGFFAQNSVSGYTAMIGAGDFTPIGNTDHTFFHFIGSFTPSTTSIYDGTAKIDTATDDVFKTNIATAINNGAATHMNEANTVNTGIATISNVSQNAGTGGANLNNQAQVLTSTGDAKLVNRSTTSGGGNASLFNLASSFSANGEVYNIMSGRNDGGVDNIRVEILRRSDDDEVGLRLRPTFLGMAADTIPDVFVYKLPFSSGTDGQYLAFEDTDTSLVWTTPTGSIDFGGNGTTGNETLTNDNLANVPYYVYTGKNANDTIFIQEDAATVILKDEVVIKNLSGVNIIVDVYGGANGIDNLATPITLAQQEVGRFKWYAAGAYWIRTNN